MGVFEAIRKSRAKTKAEVKAAQTHARQLAKQEAKADESVAKLLDKAEKRLLKEEKKGLKRKQKHEKDLAKAHLKRIQESGITQKKAKQWVSAARVLVPVLLQKLGRDPALGSSVLLTFTTDSMGFFIFLGLATIFFA